MSKIHGHVVVVYENIEWIFVIKVHSDMRVSHAKVAYMYPSSLLVGGIIHT